MISRLKDSELKTGTFFHYVGCGLFRCRRGYLYIDIKKLNMSHIRNVPPGPANEGRELEEI
jgi:hypothetical protein